VKYGSTFSGLINKNTSDLDLTFVIKDFDLSHREILSDIKSALFQNQSQRGRYQFEHGMPRSDKAGWLLKLRDTKHKMYIDIMVNKISEIHNSNLLLHYAMLEPKFHKVCIYLKSKNYKKENRLNNYSLYLMLIAYM
jgi:DNA polymerase sigma